MKFLRFIAPIALALPYLLYAVRGGMPHLLPGYLAALIPLLLAGGFLLSRPGLRHGLARNPPRTLALVMIILFLTAFPLGRLWNPEAHGPEIYNFHQEFIDTLEGGFFMHPTENRTEFAIHFSPVLFLALPVFALFKSPAALFGMSSLLVILSLPICHRFLKRTWPEDSALLLAIGAALFPSILTCHIDFSPVRFAPVAVWSLMLAYREGNRRLFILAVLFSWMVKETLLLAVIMLSATALWERRNAFWILAPAILGGALFLLTNQVLLPAFAGTAGKTSTVAAQFGYWGETPIAVLKGFASNPLSVVGAILRLNNLAYLLKIGQGVLWFAPLLSPLTLLALPEMLVNMMAGYNPPLFDPTRPGPWTSLLGHYSVTIGVVLWGAAAEGLLPQRGEETDEEWRARCWRRAVWLFLAVLSTVIYPTNAESL